MSKDISANSMECCGGSQGDLGDLGAYTKFKGEHNGIKGDSGVAFRKKEAFKKRWERMKVYVGGINHHSGYFLH